MKTIETVKKYYGLIIIAAAFIVAALVVALNNIGNPFSAAGHVVESGETIDSIASNFGITAKAIYDANYPDINEKTALTPGMRLAIPGGGTGKKTSIMIVHWQVEPGVREAVDFMAREYEKLHPNVHIVQNAMPSQTYGQWFVTQMVGGNPPDLIEVGQGVPYNILIQYYLRYFHTMTEYVSAPNPYNRGNEFANVPLKDTMRDGMRQAYVPEVQEYMTIPLSFFMIRLFYNRQLYTKLTGKTSPPKDWREFIADCKKIRTQKFMRTPEVKRMAELVKRRDALAAGAPERDQIAKEMAAVLEKSPPYVPLANTGGYFHMTRQYMIDPVTTTVRYLADLDRDGLTRGDEMYFAMRLGKVDMKHPAYTAAFTMLDELSRNALVEGFIGLDYHDGPLMFLQQRAVFYAMGTWDVTYVQKYAEENGFDIDVIDFPIPARDDPEFGRFIQGPIMDRAFQGFPFACPTPHGAPERKKAAIDFLLFLSSKDNNAKLNATIGWMPSVRNIELSGILARFSQRLDGVPGAMEWTGFGGETAIKWQQMYNLFLVGQIPYEKLVSEYQPYYLKLGVKDIQNWYKNSQIGIVSAEKALAMLRSKAFAAPTAAARDEYFSKYRFATRRSTGLSLGYYRTRGWMEELEKSPSNVSRFNPTIAPYEFTPEARARIER